jgi:hypothetical protein
MRAQTDDDVWLNLRPPLDALDEAGTPALRAQFSVTP